MTAIERANARMNEALMETWPDEILFNGIPIPCIAPPLDVFKTINPSTYDAKVTFTFQILESDRAANGMKLQDTIEFETPYAEQLGKDRLAFQIKNFQPDKTDSMVRVICNLKQ